MTLSQFSSIITYSIIYLLSLIVRIVFLFSYLNPQMPIFFHSVPGREGEQLAPQGFLLYVSLGSYIISLGFPKVSHYVCKNKICMFNFKFITRISSFLCPLLLCSASSTRLCSLCFCHHHGKPSFLFPTFCSVFALPQ